MRLKRLISICSLCALAAGLMALTLRGQTTTQPSASPEAPPTAHVSADARALLDKIRDSYGKLTTLDLAGSSSIRLDAGGQKRNDTSAFTAAFRAPNKFRHEMKDDVTIVSTGDKLYTFLARKNVYVTDAAPKSRADGLPDEVVSLLMDQDPSLALALSPNASDLLTSGALDVSLGEETKLNGASYPTLKIVQDDEDQTVLIDPRTNLIRRVQHDITRSIKRQGVPNVNVALVTLDYALPSGAAKPPTVSFDWTPPADAKPYAPPPPEGIAAADAQLAGKPAPAFTLKGLDGKSVSLSDLKGNVVVIDFWATWCPLCRVGLPHIDNVAKARAGENIKFLAIDEPPEEAAQVQTFLQQTKLSLPILADYDGDGSVGEKYLLHEMPETVVIDKNGMVRKVFTLPSFPDEEKALNDEIDAALRPR
jgi:thiol-disulfide isomerase/thioredoxin/outer membrane lipoprotein-sorting protein